VFIVIPPAYNPIQRPSSSSRLFARPFRFATVSNVTLGVQRLDEAHIKNGDMLIAPNQSVGPVARVARPPPCRALARIRQQLMVTANAAVEQIVRRYLGSAAGFTSFVHRLLLLFLEIA
jgi:hypothetical protein